MPRRAHLPSRSLRQIGAERVEEALRTHGHRAVRPGPTGDVSVCLFVNLGFGSAEGGHC